MTGALVVASARDWIGTPYVHQASRRGAGCDCLGLIRGVWRDLYGAEPESIPAYSPDWSEPQGNEALWDAASRNLDRTSDELRSGNIILFRMRQGAVAKHLGVVARDDDAPTFIHAYSGHGVVESPLSEPWRRRIVAQFVFR